MLAGQHLVCRGDDRRGTRCIDYAQLRIDECRRALDERECVDQLARHPLIRNGEVVQGALGLCAPQAISGNLDVAECVVLDAERGSWIVHGKTAASKALCVVSHAAASWAWSD